MGRARGRGLGRAGLDSLNELDDCMKATLGCVCCAILITIATLIGVSFRSLEPNEVGLRWNQVTMNIDSDTLYSAGRHFVGVGNVFIKYPKTVQTVKLTNDSSTGEPIKARTQDGLPISLAISFNFRVNTNLADLLELYFDFGDMTEVSKAYNRIARDVVRTVAAEHAAFSFFANRSSIEAEMNAKMRDELFNHTASLESFELLDIALPPRFEQARVRQLAAFEAIQEAKNRRSVAEREAVTRVGRAQEEARSFILSANAYAQTIEFQNQAAMESLAARYDASKEAYALLAQNLQLNSTELLAYIWLDAIAAARGSGIKVVYSTQSGADFAPVP